MAKTQDILKHEIYPRLFQQADGYFPEFGFKKSPQGWRSTNTLKIDATEGDSKGKVYIYGNNPVGMKDYRLGFITFWDYIANQYGLSSSKEVLHKLADMTGVNLEQFKSNQFISTSKSFSDDRSSGQTSRQKAPVVNPRLLYQAQEMMARNLQNSYGAAPVRKYLENERKITMKEAADMKLGFLSDRTDLASRLSLKCSESDVQQFMGSLTGNIGRQYQLMIPYTTVDLELRGFIARAITPQENQPKYLYSKGMKRSDTLFSLDCMFSRNPLIVVEGVLDSLLIQKRLDISTVALGGTSLNDGQLVKIKSIKPSVVILALDNDPAGNAAAMNVISKIQAQAPELPYRVLQTPSYFKDPDAWIRGQGIEAFSSALDTVMNSYSAQSGLTIPIERNSVLLDFLSAQDKQQITYQETVKSKQLQA